MNAIGYKLKVNEKVQRMKDFFLSERNERVYIGKMIDEVNTFMCFELYELKRNARS